MDYPPMHTKRDFYYCSHSWDWEVNGEEFMIAIKWGVRLVIRAECGCWMECDPEKPGQDLHPESYATLFDCPHLPTSMSR